MTTPSPAFRPRRSVSLACTARLCGASCGLSLALLASCSAAGGVLPARERLDLPAADRVLARVREAMPSVPLRLTGLLQSRSPSGEIEQTCPADIRLDWGSTPPTATYIIRDAFGAELERLVMRWPASGRAEYEYRSGDPPAPAELPDLTQTIQGMDFTWADLSLDFLWWSGGRTAGTEKRKGRPCYILDVPAPPHAVSAYSGVRLWVDAEVHVLLQAEAYDRDRQRVRRLQVKSLKRVNDLWTIQNLDIQTFPSRHKTTLRVRDLEVLGEKQGEEEP